VLSARAGYEVRAHSIRVLGRTKNTTPPNTNAMGSHRSRSSSALQVSESPHKKTHMSLGVHYAQAFSYPSIVESNNWHVSIIVINGTSIASYTETVQIYARD
jgi:hypothetical protein